MSPSHGDQHCRQLLQQLPGAVYACDAEGRITFYNQAAATLWGRAPVIGQDKWCGSWRIYRPDGTPLPHEQCPMAQALSRGRAIRDVEILVERSDGIRRNILPHPEPIFDDSGAVVGAVNMLVDITERRRAEEALGNSEEQMRGLIAMLPVAVYTCDMEGRITYFNQRAVELWGREPRLGDTDQKFCGAFRLWRPDGTLLPHAETPMALAIREGVGVQNMEVTIDQPEGRRVTV
jgi:PAS domain S-box-containing protein